MNTLIQARKKKKKNHFDNLQIGLDDFEEMISSEKKIAWIDSSARRMCFSIEPVDVGVGK